MLPQEQAGEAYWDELERKACIHTLQRRWQQQSPLLGSASLCSVHRRGVNPPAQSVAGVCYVRAVPQKPVILATANLPDSPAYFGSLVEVNVGCLFQS